MPHIEVLPNSTSLATPGYAFVPDTRLTGAQVAAQPAAGRKRAARTTGLPVGDTTARQQSAVLKHLADLDRENHRDVHFSLPAKPKDNHGKGSF